MRPSASFERISGDIGEGSPRDASRRELFAME